MKKQEENSTKSPQKTEETQEQTQEGLLPHLESLERMMKLPCVEAAWQQGQGVYGKVKGEHSIQFQTACASRGLLTH